VRHQPDAADRCGVYSAAVFMLASNFTEWRSIALNAPAARAAAAVSAQAVLVRVHDDGGIDLNGTALLLEMLDQRLQPLLQRNPNQAVIVRPDAEVALQVLVRVLDRLNAGGARSITLHEN
jgi:biopolymer transport protein ExbD